MKFVNTLEWSFQNFNLFPNKTVGENITLALKLLKKLDEKSARQIALDLLTRVGLADKIDMYPAKLSGGQKTTCGYCTFISIKS